MKNSFFVFLVCVASSFVCAQPLLDCPLGYRRMLADEQSATGAGYFRIASGTINNLVAGTAEWEISAVDTADTYRIAMAFSGSFSMPYNFTARQGDALLLTRTGLQSFAEFVVYPTKMKEPILLQVQFMDIFSLQNMCGVYNIYSTRPQQKDTATLNTAKDIKGYKAIFRAGLAFPPLLHAGVEFPLKNKNWSMGGKLTYSPRLEFGRNANAEFLHTPTTLRMQAECRYYRNLARRLRANKDIRAHAGTYISLSYEQNMRFEKVPRARVLPFGAWFYLPNIELADMRNIGRTSLGFVHVLFGSQRNLRTRTNGWLGYVNAYGGIGCQVIPFQHVGIRVGLDLGVSQRIYK